MSLETSSQLVVDRSSQDELLKINFNIRLVVLSVYRMPHWLLCVCVCVYMYVCVYAHLR